MWTLIDGRQIILLEILLVLFYVGYIYFSKEKVVFFKKESSAKYFLKLRKLL